MKRNDVWNLFNDSSSMLRIATDELNRPGEDTVTLCACQSTRTAVIGFLRSYLLEKKSLEAHFTLENLLAECAGMDSGFKNIDISCFACKNLSNDCSDGYCLAHDKVSECYERARMIEEFVLVKLKVNPNDLD